MIAFLVTNKHRYTIEAYLDWWAPQLRSRIRVVPYEGLAAVRTPPPLTYVFSDLERLLERSLGVARRLRDRIHELYESPHILNDPVVALVRHDLLAALNGARINDFAAYRVSDSRTPRRFPVFVREVHSHSGPLTPLLQNQENLDRALDKALKRFRADDLLIVEFCDTSDVQGVYAKFGAFVIGPRIMPRHVFFGRDWKVKSSDLVEAEQLAQEASYLESNPHEAELRRIFDLASIDYGRVDYGVVDGRVQVWEINTNPMVIPPADRVKHPERVAFKRENAQLIADAFEEIDEAGIALYGRRPTHEEIGSLPEVRYERWRRVRHRLGAYGVVRRPYDLVRDGSNWLKRRF